LESKVKELHRRKQVKVYKSGGDKFLWFLRKGGISREPDFKEKQIRKAFRNPESNPKILIVTENF
ncbi:MAG: hypothetical protein ACUVQM_06660, partial [Candidatus Hadarchaeaceae archaeon]